MEKGERLEARIEAQLREWAAELDTLKAKADKAAAEVRKEYYDHVDELRKEIEAALRRWSKAVDASEAKAESAEPAAKTLIERLHGRIQAELRELRPLIDDLRDRAEQAEKEARRLAKEARQAPARPGGARRIEVRRGEGLGRAQGGAGQCDHEVPGAVLRRRRGEAPAVVPGVTGAGARVEDVAKAVAQEVQPRAPSP